MMIGKRVSAALLATVAACALTGGSPAHAQSVVVYSAVSPKVMTAFVDEFQKQNPGLKVDLISGGSGELLTRLQAEGANPAQSGSAYSQMQQILQLYGWDVMDKVVGVATFVTSSRLAYQNVAKGEISVGLTSEFNIVASRAEGFPVEAVYPKDGTALINDASGIVRGGPHPDAARISTPRSAS